MCLALPGRVLSTSLGDDGITCGSVDFEGVVKEISFALVPEVRAGDYVVAQMGMALEVLTEAEAAQARADLIRLRDGLGTA